jgi:hypothetical protein
MLNSAAIVSANGSNNCSGIVTWRVLMRGTADTGIDRRASISGMTAASALGGVPSTAVEAQTAAPSVGFSFAACGIRGR